MLVDVLGALYAGRAAFEDTARAISDLAKAFDYGSNWAARGLASGVIRAYGATLPSYVSRMTDMAAQKLSNRRIERIAFVATKADHVPALKRDNLLNLVRDLAGHNGSPAAHKATVTHRIAASILSTRDAAGKIGGRPVEVVEGVVLGEEVMRKFFVGDVPSGLPPPSFWDEQYFDLPVFRPPVIDASGQTGIPHLNLDQVLDDVIGGLL